MLGASKSNSMLSYSTLIKYFGTELSNESFQSFLNSNFTDLTEYNILESEYINSTQKGLELGFKNDTAVFDDDSLEIFEKGNPVFSHFNLFPICAKYLNDLPFDTSFENSRDQIQQKAGVPTKIREGYLEILNKHFRIDNYQMGDIIISFDYIPETDKLDSIQIRSLKLTKTEV